MDESIDYSSQWCQVYGGHISWPLLPCREQVINLETIAHSLAMQCRYNGHCNKFYSVAEHSCYVANEAFGRTKSYTVALQALLHDATEAYLGDIPRPIKKLIPDYIKIEGKWHEKIFNFFDLPTEMPSVIKLIDYQLLKTEAEQIMHWPPPQPWGFPEGLMTLDINIEGWDAMRAKTEFLEEFEFYREGVEDEQSRY